MVTGQGHVDEACRSSQFHILGYVRHMIENNHFEEVVDAKLNRRGGKCGANLLPCHSM